MNGWVERLEIELIDLTEKTKRLENFLVNMEDIKEPQRTLLFAQVNIMRSYCAILQMRYDDSTKI